MKTRFILIVSLILYSLQGNSQVYSNLAWKKFNEGNFSDALYWANKSLDAEPDQKANAYTIRGMCKTQMGEYGEAEKDLFLGLAARKKGDKRDKAYFNISLNYLYQGRNDAALLYADSSLMESPDDPITINHKATVYGQMGKNKEAIELEKKALLLDSACHDCLVNMGWYLYSDEQFQQAIPYYNKALAQSPYYTQALANRGYCYAAMGELDKAITDLDSALVGNPNALGVIAKKGEIRFQQKKFVEACNNFDELKSKNDSMGSYYISKYCDNREVISYYPNGKMSMKCTYKNGVKNGKWQSWYENGQLEEDAMVVNGKEEGPVVLYHENGKIRQQGKEVNGETVGEWKEYYPSGAIKTKVNFVAGKMEGPAFSYYEDGKLEGEYIYKNGQLDGEQKKYHPNGKLMIRVVSKNGRDLGPPEQWDEQGNPVQPK